MPIVVVPPPVIMPTDDGLTTDMALAADVQATIKQIVFLMEKSTMLQKQIPVV